MNHGRNIPQPRGVNQKTIHGSNHAHRPGMVPRMAVGLLARQPPSVSPVPQADSPAQACRRSIPFTHLNQRGRAAPLVQPKIPVVAPEVRRPTAPAAYRPQPTPHVLQRKVHNAQPQSMTTTGTRTNLPGAPNAQPACIPMRGQLVRQSNQAPSGWQTKLIPGARDAMQRKALSGPLLWSSSASHIRKVIQRAEQIPKEERRTLKARMLMELREKNLECPENEDIAFHIKNKVCNTEAVKLKVLVLSDSTPEHIEGGFDSRLRTLSDQFARKKSEQEAFDVKATYFDDENFPKSKKLDQRWHPTPTDINDPNTFPAQQYDLILARNVICFCHKEEQRSCGGVPKSTKEAKKALDNVALKLSTKKGARALLTIPIAVRAQENQEFWRSVMDDFNASSTDYVALTMSHPKIGFYGIKIKPKKKG